MRYNEEKLKKMHQPIFADSSYKKQESRGQFSLNSRSKDQELPMPPLALVPLHREGIRYVSVTLKVFHTFMPDFWYVIGSAFFLLLLKDIWILWA